MTTKAETGAPTKEAEETKAEETKETKTEETQETKETKEETQEEETTGDETQKKSETEDGAGKKTDASQEKEEKGKEKAEAPEHTELSTKDLKVPTFEYLGEKKSLDDAAVKELISFSNEKKLPKDVAQALLEREAVKAQAQAEAVEKAGQKWEQELKDDKALGGDNFEETKAKASQWFQRFGDDQLLEYLETTRLGNNPAVVRALVRCVETMTPKQLVLPSSETPAAEKTAEDTLYDNDGSNEE